MSKEIFLNFCSKYLLLTMVASLSFWMTGCSDDDDTGGGGTVVEDGLYVKAPVPDLRISVQALFKVTKMKCCRKTEPIYWNCIFR
ncbi:MAG: hypothetical protein IPI30_04260 [Saprospiraceae bacterium]|nr:hypothetical protein [Candidatus Vicinibacter affinis]